MTSPIYQFPRSWLKSATAKCSLRSRSQSSASPWTGRRNVYGPHAQLWVIEVSFSPLVKAEALAIEAFFDRVAGTSGLVRMGSPIQRRPQFDDDVDGVSVGWSDGSFFDDGSGWASGHLPPYVVIKGGETIGATSVVIGGDLPASTTRVMRRADLIEFQRNGVADETPSLHRVMVDANTNSDGDTRIEIRPPLRKGVAAEDRGVLRDPQSVFRLAQEDSFSAEYDIPKHGALGFSLIENLL